jgi:hypothetical protein
MFVSSWVLSLGVGLFGTLAGLLFGFLWGSRRTINFMKARNALQRDQANACVDFMRHMGDLKKATS